MEFGQCSLDALHGLDEFVLARGIRQADTVVVAEGVASHASHMGIVKQPHAEVVAALDGGLAVGLAVERLHFREHIESTGGSVALHTWNLVQQLHEGVAAVTEGLQHFLDFRGVLGAEFHGLGCGGLRDGANAGGDLALDLVGGLHDGLGRGDVADTPTRHGIALGHAVDEDEAVFQEIELAHALVLLFVLDELINLVGDDDDLGIFLQDFGDGGQFGLGEHAAAGVARRVDHEHLGLGCDGLFELLGGDLRCRS